MKRKREVEVDKTNHLFKSISIQPDIMIHIFSNLLLIDLLIFYKLLYYHLKKDNKIITVMENYLKDQKNGMLVGMKIINNYFFDKKILKYKNYDDPPLEPQDFIEKLTKYQEFRFTRNFVKYGLCSACHSFPDYIHEIYGLNNIIENELESRIIYICQSCDLQYTLWNSTEEFIRKMKDDLLIFFANEHGIRYMINGDTNEMKFFARDIFHYDKRRQYLIKNKK